MILTCDECQTHYLLGGGLLGADGRRVRCSHCGHEWFQDAEEGETFADTLAKTDPIPDSVKPHHDYEPESVPALPTYTDAATAQPGGGIAGYVLAGALLLIALGGGFVFSSAIVKLWPPSLAVYQALHVAPKIPGDGLVIDRVRAEVVSGDRGLNILKVSGYALNKMKDAVKIPPLRVSLRRKGGEEIDNWLIAAPKEELGYEEEVAFSTTYPAPPMDAKEVNVRLEPFATVIHVKRDGEPPAEEKADHHEAPVPAAPAHETPRGPAEHH